MQNDKIKLRLETFSKAMESCPLLVYAGSNNLREKSVEVSLGEGLEIVEKLKETILNYRKVTGLGRGIAGNQIGFNKRVFVTYVDNVFQVYINAKMIEKSEKQNLFRELCMSSGLLWGDVKRPEKIKLNWIDETGTEHTQEFGRCQKFFKTH